MDRSITLPALIAFAFCIILGPALIRYLHRLKFGQYIREEGPKAHQKKSGTPTMGGLLFLAATLVGSLFWFRSYPEIVPIVLVTLGFALVGFLDDFIKVVMKRNLGLRAWQKMGLQFVITAAFCIYIVRYSGLGTVTRIPFSGGRMASMPVGLFVVFFFFVVLGTVNGSNFTDGLDGLAASVTSVIAIFLMVVAILQKAGIHPVCSAMLGALLGFLWFNTYPAKVFMGDTGSLALGGFVVSAAFLMQIPLFIPIVAFIYLIEVLSVIIQVAYFKKTGGKRIFKMAPIHHHFELSGWPETKVVSIFTIVTAVLCLIGMLAF